MVIRPFNISDKNQILNLLNNIFKEQQRYAWFRNDDYWHWKYESNVFGNPIIYVAEQKDEIIASSTLWPWSFICRGQIVQAYQPCDTVVKPEFQKKGVFSEINNIRIKQLINDKTPLVFNFPNNKSLKGNLNSGWHYLTKIPWLIRPINPMGMIKNIRGENQLDNVGLKNEHKPDWGDCYNLSKNQQSFNGTISTHRKEGYFEWRFGRHPFFDYGIVIVGKGRNAAGAVFSINQKNNTREMLVVDIIGNKNRSLDLFKKIVHISRSYKADFIATIFNPHFNMNQLWRMGFVKIHNKNMVVLPLDVKYESKATNYNNWSVVGGMHDSI